MAAAGVKLVLAVPGAPAAARRAALQQHRAVTEANDHARPACSLDARFARQKGSLFVHDERSRIRIAMKSKADLDQEKQRVAKAAVAWVRSGMRLGLGSGSTSEWFTRHLAEALRTGALRDVVAVPTSEKVAALASSLGIPLTDLAEGMRLDLTVDGADEIDPGLQLIKGGGGALLREKVVATASRWSLVMADSSKLVAKLGKFPLPLEVAPFAEGYVKTRIAEIGGRAKLRTNAAGATAVTDQGLWLLDCHFGDPQSPVIENPRALQEALVKIPGVAAHGLFLDTTTAAIVADGENVAVHTRRGIVKPEEFRLG
jgi:ribose 5-phosphate isomerase A